MKTMTREELWSVLRQATLVEGEMPAQGEACAPWFVRVMLGLAGWIGALFLLGFVGFGLAFVVKDQTTSWVVGAGACAAVAMLFSANRNGDFSSQFGLAVGLAGQALMIYAMSWSFEHDFTALALAIAAQQALLFILLPNFVHRIWAAWSGVFALSVALAGMGLYAFAPAIVTAGFAVVWLREFEHPLKSALLRSGGYGLALAGVQTVMMSGSLRLRWLLWNMGRRDAGGGEMVAWAGALGVGAVLIGIVLLLLHREKVALNFGPGKAALAAGVVLALASLKAPGVGPGAAILLVGYANGNRVLVGLGVAALVGYLSHYYYALHATLLEKSALLACTGIALLAVRFAMLRWWPLKKEGGSHA